MNRYTVITVAINIANGRLRLTPEQAKSRLHNLKDCGKGLYQVLNPVQFKRGEQFDYDGTLPKGMAQQAITPEQAKAAADAKAKEDKKAKAEKVAAEKAAADKAAAMEDAVKAADAVVLTVRQALDELGDKADPDMQLAIEQAIDEMGERFNQGDLDGLKDAIAALDEHAKKLIKKP